MADEVTPTTETTPPTVVNEPVTEQTTTTTTTTTTTKPEAAVAEPVAALDPMQEFMQTHLKRMEEINTHAFEKAKEAASIMEDRLKRNVGLRDAVLDRTLAALGISPADPTV